MLARNTYLDVVDNPYPILLCLICLIAGYFAHKGYRLALYALVFIFWMFFFSCSSMYDIWSVSRL
jgi:hypothetical protein